MGWVIAIKNKEFCISIKGHAWGKRKVIKALENIRIKGYSWKENENKSINILKVFNSRSKGY